MRKPNEFYEELRFGFVIVDSKNVGRDMEKYAEIRLKIC